MVGIVLVTDPFGGLDVEPLPEVRLEADGQFPNALVSKLIGIIFCIPSMFGQAAECKFVHFKHVITSSTDLITSGVYEEGRGPSHRSSDDGLSWILPCLCRCRVSKEV